MTQLTWLDFHTHVRLRYELKKKPTSTLRQLIDGASKQRLIDQATKTLETCEHKEHGK